MVRFVVLASGRRAAHVVSGWTARAAFGDSTARRGRLFAFGYDAFRLANSLKRGNTIEPRGLTGTLSLDAQGRVRRDLQWVRIKGGAPAPLDPAQTAAIAAP